MGSNPLNIREPARLSGAPGSAWTGAPGTNWIAVATVGYEDEPSESWISVRSGQLLVEITMRTGNSLQRGRARVAAGLRYDDLEVGEQVLVAFVGGSDVHGVIIGSLNDVTWALPDSVAGIETGAAAAKKLGDEGPGPAFSFLRTRAGRLLAIESGELADVLIHSGAGVEIKGSAIHMNGLVHLGAGFSVPPTPPTVTLQDLPDTGAGEGVLPGIPGVPLVPLPGVSLTIPPCLSPADGILRAKDMMQCNPAIDPALFAWYAAVDVFLKAVAGLNPVEIAAALLVYNAVPMPVTITSEPMTASMCTCADAMPAP